MFRKILVEVSRRAWLYFNRWLLYMDGEKRKGDSRTWGKEEWGGIPREILNVFPYCSPSSSVFGLNDRSQPMMPWRHGESTWKWKTCGGPRDLCEPSTIHKRGNVQCCINFVDLVLCRQVPRRMESDFSNAILRCIECLF